MEQYYLKQKRHSTMKTLDSGGADLRLKDTHPTQPFSDTIGSSLPEEGVGMGLLVPDLWANCSFRNIKGQREGNSDPGKWGGVEGSGAVSVLDVK